MATDAIVEVPKNQIEPQNLELGTQLQATHENGNTMRGIVRDIRPETVLIDFNHPLAGKTLEFEVEVLSVAPDF